MRNVCGLDVHKDNVFVCIDKENGEKIQFKTGILTRDLDSLRDFLVKHDVGEIAMESTSVYWMPIWRVPCQSFCHQTTSWAQERREGRGMDCHMSPEGSDSWKLRSDGSHPATSAI